MKMQPPHVKVVYLHSKGCYHPTASNRKLYDFFTRSALSTKCVHLPALCNIYSVCMLLLTHPRATGNMWLLRCNYVARLFKPAATARRPDPVQEDKPFRGGGWYLVKHWAHSHPSVRPCNLYPGTEFT